MDNAERKPRSSTAENPALDASRRSDTIQDVELNSNQLVQLEIEESGGGMSKARYVILVTSIFMTLFLPALDQTIVSTALPKIIASLPAGGSFAGSGYTWVGSSYALASAVVMPLYGQLSEVFGRKWVFLSAIVIFMVGSCLCGASQDVAMLIASRGIQGVGAGGILGLVMIIIGDLVGTRYDGLFQWGLLRY